MPVNKRITDLVDYTSVLPYASEMFGIYQPLLGWKSTRIEKRFESGLKNDKRALLKTLVQQFSGEFTVRYGDECKFEIVRIKPGLLKSGKFKTFDSVVLISIAQQLPPFSDYNDSVWKGLLSDSNLNSIFGKSLVPSYTDFYIKSCRDSSNVRAAVGTGRGHGPLHDGRPGSFVNALEKQLKYESAVAGSLQFLLKTKNFATLQNIFYNVDDNEELATEIVRALSAADSTEAYLNLNNLNPQDKDHLASVALSPISVVHLFRQYFFELDTFLGTPVGHVWLSPGSTVELVEVSTRRTIVEKTLETTLETSSKTEKAITQQDELSEAVKEDNKRDIKFGASVQASYASVTASTSFDLNDSQQKSREETHKRMRQQTEKLSSEIRKNVKSTFKTITETTDTSSKRYVLANTTQQLINYEMRRKMRQVGVQVQDIGSYLCWQTYVDDPGRDLGLGTLIHIATSPDYDNIPKPELISNPAIIETLHPFTIPFITKDGADKDEPFSNGREVDREAGETDGDFIAYQFEVRGILPPQSDYVFDSQTIDYQGQTVQMSLLDEPWKAKDANDEPTTAPPYNFKINLDSVNFQGKDSINVNFVFRWKPSRALLDSIKAKNDTQMAQANAKSELEFRRTYIENIKNRVKLASKLETRPSDELREEERIVVYRRLIQDMLSHGISMPDDRTRHVVSELINSIFDVDKMLYFVAPEWWRPRLHRSHQQLGAEAPISSKVEVAAASAQAAVVQNAITSSTSQSASATGQVPSLSSSTVGWGDTESSLRDNYFITEDSEPARLGSSLGWLLQLDGDNMRNAFLNAPWVKAVIPIRPGREEAAINWLKGVEGFNGIGPTDLYHSTNPNETDINGNSLSGQPLIDVLMDLAKKIKRKHSEGLAKGVYPKQNEVANPELVDAENVVTSVPIDRVYEHGFYALKGGFKANVSANYEIFDQWIEVLPTDQVVPVQVNYDPKTGRQV